MRSNEHQSLRQQFRASPGSPPRCNHAFRSFFDRSSSSSSEDELHCEEGVTHDCSDEVPWCEDESPVHPHLHTDYFATTPEDVFFYVLKRKVFSNSERAYLDTLIDFCAAGVREYDAIDKRLRHIRTSIDAEQGIRPHLV